MKKILYLFIILFTQANCTDRKKVGKCCDESYSSIDNALACYSHTNDGNGTSSDERLFLLAFVNKNIETNQKLGWNIIKDQDIINVAKQNYLLITLDVNHFKIPEGQNAPELMETINSNKDSLFFVIVNSALHPFADWNSKEQKDIIIDRLQIGNGP